MRVASVIHKVIFALALAVAVVHFAMVVQAAWEGVAGIDNLETWLRMHTASVSPFKNSNFRSLSEADYRYSETILATTHVAWCAYWGAVSGLTMLYYLVHLIVRFARPASWFVCSAADLGFNFFWLIATAIAIAAGRVVDSDWAPLLALVFGIIQLVLFALILTFETIYITLKRHRGHVNVLRTSIDALSQSQANGSQDGEQPENRRSPSISKSSIV